MVIVEPESSSRWRRAVARGLGEPGHFGGAIPDAARFGMAHHRHDQAGGRLRRDADMHGAVAGDDAGIVVERRIDARLLGNRLDQRPHQEGQDRQLRLVRLAAAFIVARRSSRSVTSTSST